MTSVKTFVALCLIGTLSGCGRTYKPINRFVPVETQEHAGVALDTATGTLCKTWNWTYNENAPAEIKHGMDDLKTCFELYKEDQIDVPAP